MFYRQTTNPSLLARATSEVRAAIPRAQNVTITSLLVVTWSEVGYYFQKTDKVILACTYTARHPFATYDICTKLMSSVILDQYIPIHPGH